MKNQYRVFTAQKPNGPMSGTQAMTLSDARRAARKEAKQIEAMGYLTDRPTVGIYSDTADGQIVLVERVL